MGKIVKWFGVILAGLVIIILLAGTGLYSAGAKRLKVTYTVPANTVAVPTDATSIGSGKHLVIVHCTSCHGVALEGDTVFTSPPLGTITAPSIAGGRGKYGTTLSDVELVRAIRHGVGIDGKPLFVMPSGSFYYFTDNDLGNIIAYIRSVEPLDITMPVTRITPLGIALYTAGMFGDLINAENIDHTAPRPAAVEPGVTVEYGNYQVRVGECRVCHGPQLAGGKDPNPDAPPAPNLTRGGNLGGWSETDFIQTMRSGVNPTGHQLTEFMPWKFFGQMTDDELKAVWLYLQSLPPLETTK